MVWGGTFVNSKVLLLNGMRAEEIFVVRFLLAYLCILTISPHRLFADKVGDELLMALLGITGGSLYFAQKSSGFFVLCNQCFFFGLYNAFVHNLVGRNFLF